MDRETIDEAKIRAVQRRNNRLIRYAVRHFGKDLRGAPPLLRAHLERIMPENMKPENTNAPNYS